MIYPKNQLGPSYRGVWMCIAGVQGISKPPVTWDPMILRILESPYNYNWVVCHPFYTLNKQGFVFNAQLLFFWKGTWNDEGPEWIWSIGQGATHLRKSSNWIRSSPRFGKEDFKKKICENSTYLAILQRDLFGARCCFRGPKLKNLLERWPKQRSGFWSWGHELNHDKRYLASRQVMAN